MLEVTTIIMGILFLCGYPVGTSLVFCSLALSVLNLVLAIYKKINGED